MSKIDPGKILGQRVQKCRESQKLSQEKLAEMADVSVSFISRLERGVESPTVANLVKVAGGLGVKVKDLIEF